MAIFSSGDWTGYPATEENKGHIESYLSNIISFINVRFQKSTFRQKSQNEFFNLQFGLSLQSHAVQLNIVQSHIPNVLVSEHFKVSTNTNCVCNDDPKI